MQIKHLQNINNLLDFTQCIWMTAGSVELLPFFLKIRFTDYGTMKKINNFASLEQLMFYRMNQYPFSFYERALPLIPDTFLDLIACKI